MVRTIIEQNSAPISLKPKTLAQAKWIFSSSHRFSLRRDCHPRTLRDSRVLA